MRDPGLADWRLLRERLVTTYRAPTYADAAGLVPRIAAAAAADVDLRPSGVVHVTVAADDVAGAEAVSALVAEAGLTGEPAVAVTTEVAVDAMDIATVRPFWRAVLGYVDDGDDALADPERIGPSVWFQQMDRPRPQRNRIHVDVTVPHDVADARIAEALAAGGTLLSDREARAFWVLADPEGNEACICTWEDRD